MDNDLLNQLLQIHPILLAALATGFSWLMTALGAAPVFFTKTLNKRVMAAMLGFAAGVMIAASYFSLLGPAIEMSGGDWLPATAGFLFGGIFFFIVDKILPHLHPGLKEEDREGIPTPWRRSVLLILAVTFHNIPEGLAVGIAFGGMAHAADPAMAQTMLLGGIALAIGMGLQNLPEGLAVAMPLRCTGMGRFKAFLFGQASGMVEPIAGILGAWLVLSVESILPYGLAFAAGAMIFVVVEELIPESQQTGETDLATLGVISGFTIMMVLDIALS